MQVNVHEAKTQLSKLIEAALNGEEIVIARRGKPAVRLEAVEEKPKGIVLGLLQGQWKGPEPDWFAPLDDDILDGIENGTPTDPIFGNQRDGD